MRTLIKTTDLTHDAWLEQRKKGVGGSDAASILGLNPYKTQIDVWLDKMGKSEPIEDNEAMRQGRDLEEYVAQRFADETGKRVKRRNAILQHDRHDWMIGDVDRFIVGEHAGLECKTTNIYNWKSLKANGPPDYYELQCHHYMAVTGMDRWYLAVLVLGRDFKIYTIERDEEMIAMIEQAEGDFWNRYILTEEMPAPDGSHSADVALGVIYPEATEGKEVDLSNYELRINRYKELGDLVDTLEIEMEQIRQLIKKEMEDAERASIKGGYVSWKNVTSTRIDTKRLKAEKPELWVEYAKESTSRRFDIKIKEEI